MTQDIQYIIYQSHIDIWIGEMILFWSLHVDVNWEPLFNKLDMQVGPGGNLRKYYKMIILIRIWNDFVDKKFWYNQSSEIIKVYFFFRGIAW